MDEFSLVTLRRSERAFRL